MKSNYSFRPHVHSKQLFMGHWYNAGAKMSDIAVIKTMTLIIVGTDFLDCAAAGEVKIEADLQGYRRNGWWQINRHSGELAH